MLDLPWCNVIRIVYYFAFPYLPELNPGLNLVFIAIEPDRTPRHTFFVILKSRFFLWLNLQRADATAKQKGFNHELAIIPSESDCCRR